jgi:hypothetical protein
MPGRARRLLAALALLGVALLAAASGSVAHGRRVTIETRAVAPHGVRLLGAISRSATVRGAVVLRPRDDGALRSFIAAATDPGSASFHHYLAPDAFAARFGPSERAVDAVRGRLRSDGLTVGASSRDGLVVPFRGSAARVQDAFSTELSSYAMPDGAVAHAPTTSVSLPAGVAGDVATVLGLDDILTEHRLGPPPRATRHRDRAARAAAAPAAAGGPRACADATGAASQFGGLTDDAIADAYGAGSLYAAGDTGAGQRIAVYELEPFERSDVRTFDGCYFGASRAARMQRRLHLHMVDGGQPRGPGSGEASLDVENLSALAPGAQIDVYAGPAPNANPNVYDAFDEYAAIVDDDSDQVVTTSWGLCEQAVQSGQQGLQQAESYLFQQAAAQGQTVFSAAGDNGSDDCNTNETPTPAQGQNPVSVDDPASQPYVLGVGGATIDAAGSPPLEHVWNDGTAGGGGGGGISESWRMPSWQQQASIPGIARPGGATWRAADKLERSSGYAPGFCQAHAPGATSSTPCRLVPDVSAQGDEYTGAITVYSHEYVSRSTPTGWTTTGGTSSSAPIWAAMLALVNASPTCRADGATAGGVGFAAPLLYRVASDPAADAASFTDVRAGSNDTYGISNGRVFAATRGYDPASGLGSPLLAGPDGAAGLAYHLCSLAPSPARPAVTGLRPASGSAAGGERIRIAGSGFEAHGRSRVASIQIGARPIAAGRFHVRGAHTIVATLPSAGQGLAPDAHAARDGAGPAQVIVTLRQGASSTPGPRSRFTYVATGGRPSAPTVAAVTPNGGLRSAAGSVTVLGSGFHRVSSVTFGGVRATHVTVRGADRITVRAPRITAATACAKLPHAGVYAGENAGNDVCQVQVRVRTAEGVSAPSRIRPPLEGPLWRNVLGVLLHPACSCEVAQADDEFDYLPRPRIDSVSTSGGPASLASERGGSVITVKGSGLNPLDIDWANFGDPANDASVHVGYVFLSGRKMQIRAPRHEVTLGIGSTMLSVKTLAGQSNAKPVRYAGLPAATSVINPANRTRIGGVGGAPSTGGTPIEVRGARFRGQILSLAISGLNAAEASAGTQYRFTVSNATSLRTRTTAQNPGLVAVEPCTVTGCAKGSLRAGLLLYPPGLPHVTAVSPASGPAAGGTPITVTGHGLGCPLQVLVGGVPATGVTPGTSIIGCGSTTTLTAITPAGTSQTAAPVTVTTAAGAFSGRAGSSSASFAYR